MNIVTCRGLRVTNNNVLDQMIGFIEASLQLQLVTINITRTYKQESAMVELHTFQFTSAHALGFSFSTSRSLVADLNTGTIA
jgi:hypothetical protein